MVLWEVTLATAYFLGLKRTYRLALGVQRRLIGPDNPRLRQFLHRRTRSIFDVVIKVHQNIQHRDIEAGRNLGNWVLRWLDRMKPSAEIRSLSANRCLTPPLPIRGSSNRKLAVAARKPYANLADRVSKGRLLFAQWNWMGKYSPTVAMMMMQPMKSLGMNGQLRQLTGNAYRNPLNGHNRYEGVFRHDIAILMQRN